MIWAKKTQDWSEIVDIIRSEIEANKNIISKEKISDIQFYLDHGEYSMAFEYLCLEIIEHGNAIFLMGVKKAKELALLFDLDDANECMVDADFWEKLASFCDRPVK